MPSVTDQIQNLIKVQEMDSKIGSLESQATTTPESLKVLFREMKEIEKTLLQKKKDRDHFAQTLKQTSGVIEINQDRLKRSEEKLENITNMQEMQAANKEVDQVKRMIQNFENQKMRIMEQLTEKETELKSIQEKMDQKKSEFDAEKGKFESESKTLKSQMSEILSERNQEAKNVDQKILSIYDRVRKAKNGVGLAPAAQGRCGGCHMMLPPQVYNLIQKGEELHQCPNCFRILYVGNA